MRNPVDIAASYLRSWIEKGQAPSEPAAQELSRDVREVSNEAGAQIESKIEELHAVLTLRVHDLYAETWRLRDSVDARLAALEKRLEESTSRYETSILEVESSANQVKESCRSLADTLDRQYATAETAVESLREAHDRRLRHIEQSHRTELAALEHEHETALRGHTEARKSVARRVQALAEAVSLEISSAIELSSFGAANLTPLERLAEKLQPRRRVRQLEEALLRFEREVADLARAVCADSDLEEREELIAHSLESPLPSNGAKNGNGNGNGHGKHELDFALGGLARR